MQFVLLENTAFNYSITTNILLHLWNVLISFGFFSSLSRQVVNTSLTQSCGWGGYYFTQLFLINCHVDALAHFSLPTHCFVMLHVTSVKNFFPNILGGVWEHLSFSPKEHNVKKEFEAKTEILFFFFLSKETSFSMPAGEHNWFSGGIIHSFSLCVSLSLSLFFL